MYTTKGFRCSLLLATLLTLLGLALPAARAELFVNSFPPSRAPAAALPQTDFMPYADAYAMTPASPQRGTLSLWTRARVLVAVMFFAPTFPPQLFQLGSAPSPLPPSVQPSFDIGPPPPPPPPSQIPVNPPLVPLPPPSPPGPPQGPGDPGGGSPGPVNQTPEPSTLLSGFIGLSLLSMWMWHSKSG